MNNFLKPLFENIGSTHDDHDIEESVTKKVHLAIQEHYEQNDTENEENLQMIANHLANGRVAEATQIAVTHCKHEPEKAVETPKNGAEDLH